MNDKGFTVVAFNRTTEKVDYFLANEAKGEFDFPHKFVPIISFS
jgi:6-phosphogluconate dehydrogenase